MSRIFFFIGSQLGHAKALIRSLCIRCLAPLVRQIVNEQITFWGDPARANINPTARMVNTLFNTVAGTINVGEYTFTGHNVLIITGSHHSELVLSERMHNFPVSGGDIHIGNGVWIGSSAVILGPCSIGDHSVVAAGSVVTPGTVVPAGSLVGGVPAKLIKAINYSLP